MRNGDFAWRKLSYHKNGVNSVDFWTCHWLSDSRPSIRHNEKVILEGKLFEVVGVNLQDVWIVYLPFQEIRTPLLVLDMKRKRKLNLLFSRLNNMRSILITYQSSSRTCNRRKNANIQTMTTKSVGNRNQNWNSVTSFPPRLPLSQ